ncbi:hypothetical protein WJX72_004484 [[Myrmecia] bisecta]|uniref:Ribosome-recycling factor, chloroplastic n=1 Tax=[Myrmecia] bisecta TaxID=41462 RepID=A0AAW1QQ61_9CHLO
MAGHLRHLLSLTATNLRRQAARTCRVEICSWYSGSVQCAPQRPRNALDPSTTWPSILGTHRHWFASKAKGRKAGPHADEQHGTAAPAQERLDVSVESLMSRAVEQMQQGLSGIRTGRASTGMLDSLKVDAYGSKAALKSLASVTVRDAQLLAVTVFDPSTIPQVQKAIQSSPLSLVPEASGQEILVPVPRATKDTLRGMLKLAKQEAEAARVAVRHARKVGMDEIKQLINSEDSQHRAEKEVQKLTDKFTQQIDDMLAAKEQELQVH